MFDKQATNDQYLVMMMPVNDYIYIVARCLLFNTDPSLLSTITLMLTEK